MTKIMLMDAKHPDETRVVIVDEDTIEDFDFVTESKAQVKGNIYLAKITRVEPSLQAAFVEYGGGKQGFLPFSEIHPDYYQIPVEDRQRLLEEELEEAQRAEEEEEAELEGRNKKRAEGSFGEGSGGSNNGRSRGRRRGRGRGRDREPNGDEQRAEGEEGDETALQPFVEAQDNEQASGDEAQPYDDSDSSEHSDVQPLAAQQLVVASPKIDEPHEDEPQDSRTQHEERSERSNHGRNRSHNHNKEMDDGDDQEIETVRADESEERSPRRGQAFKRYRIQEVIKRNQIVLVQVIKEERGNKGCSLTTYLSLAGRYCVLMPNSPKGGGVSRKINNGEQRKMLKEMLSELRDKRGFPAIIRTAGLDRTKAEIKRDYEYLVKMWSQIREDTLASSAPSLIYEESDIIKRCIRDMYTEDIEQVLVQGADAYRDCKNFMKLIMPSHAPRIKEYRDDAPVFASYGVETQLASMYEPEVKLPSGGYVVIQATEALTSIDVNSGRSTTERNVEETAIKTNLEAAREVARQMRLRDVAGLIVIDFIDMYYGKNRRTLEKAMKDYLHHDRAKIQLGRISPFGLMELSRQRLRPSIAESSTRSCDHCQGTGFVKSLETVAIQIIRLLEREAVMGDYVTLKVVCTADVAMHLLNDRRPQIQEIEAQNDLHIVVTIESDVQAGHFRLFKSGEDGREVLHQEQDDDKNRKRKGRGRRGGRNRNRREEGEGSSEAYDESDDEMLDAEDAQAEAHESPKEEGEADANNASSAALRRDRGPRRAHSNRDTRSNAAGASDENVPRADDAAEGSDGNAELAARPRRRGRRRANTRRPAIAGASAEPQIAAAEAQAFVAAPEPASVSANVEAASSASNQSKRKGWWNRVVQGADSDA